MEAKFKTNSTNTFKNMYNYGPKIASLSASKNKEQLDGTCYKRFQQTRLQKKQQLVKKHKQLKKT